MRLYCPHAGQRTASVSSVTELTCAWFLYFSIQMDFLYLSLTPSPFSCPLLRRIMQRGRPLSFWSCASHTSLSLFAMWRANSHYFIVSLEAPRFHHSPLLENWVRFIYSIYRMNLAKAFKIMPSLACHNYQLIAWLSILIAIICDNRSHCAV